MYVGIEIGGTKLQMGVGRGDGTIVKLWRGAVDPSQGGAGIRGQIIREYAGLLATACVAHSQIRGIGVGFGGPTDDATQSTITSHQIDGWDRFPLAGFLHENLGSPTVICNDADVAGLAEAHFGAGRGKNPIFYITVGTGIGGGLIVEGKIYRGVGRGAAEIGHLTGEPGETVESMASGTGIAGHYGDTLSAVQIVELAKAGDTGARETLHRATGSLAEGICTVITLLCPERIIIGGGVSLIGDDLFFDPIRKFVAERGFPPFAGLTDIVPAALGEEVVVHGALALARQRFQG